MLDFTMRNDKRFLGIKPFENKLWLASPTMHGEELLYIEDAFKSNWVSTIGQNINEIEGLICDKIGRNYSVALSTGTAALHMAVKLAGQDLYGRPDLGHGFLEGKRVFVSDLTFSATVNPIVYEGGIPVFIASEPDTWNMDPAALEKAFELFPEVKLVVVVNLYGIPAKWDEIKAICDKHGAIIIEDAAESLGATYKGVQTGTFGKYSCISFNGNKIITGSSGGALLTDSEEAAQKVRKWSTQAREDALWYQHEELGYNYRMSNVIAGIIRGQFMHLDEHIDRKKTIYEIYKEGLKGLPVKMNPYDADNSVPNFWLSSMIIDEASMCKQIRGDINASYVKEQGKSCPTEILEVFDAFNINGRPIWKPMHLQPIYKSREFITKEGCSGAIKNSDVKEIDLSIGMDIFNRGVCLPSDIKMTEEQQDVVIDIIHRCFL